MKISAKHLWTLIWCWQKKFNVQQTKDLTGLSIPTIRRYYELFRDNLNIDFDVVLEGKVQMDEMFVKGAFIVGAKDIVRKRIKLNVVYKKSPNRGDAMNLIQNYIKPGSTLCTDGGGIYRGCEKYWPVIHKKDIHSKFEFGLTSEIEGTWAVLRTFIRRMYHHVTVKKLAKVVREFEARYSHKEIFNSPLAFLNNSLQSVTLAL
ncbi:MAG: transposase [Chlorobi bacterium]|nr:transposase [Chlorobiota bacterium]